MSLQLFKKSLPPHKEKWEQDSDNQNDHEHNSAKHHIRQKIKKLLLQGILPMSSTEQVRNDHEPLATQPQDRRPQELE